jgi:hypothetical protein
MGRSRPRNQGKRQLTLDDLTPTPIAESSTANTGPTLPVLRSSPVGNGRLRPRRSSEPW